MSITNTGKIRVDVVHLAAFREPFRRRIFRTRNKVFNIRELAPSIDDRGEMFQLDVKNARLDAENKLIILLPQDRRKERAM